jgi:acylglycerol lipase
VGHKTITWQNETGRTVFAQAWSPEQSPNDVVLLIHGLGEHSGRYETWAQRFVKENIAVYALDLHGHGHTTGGRGHTDAFGYLYDDIQHLLSTVSSDYPEAKIHLYGHSMGGAVILGFAAFRSHNADVPPVASIVTTGTAIRPGFEPPAWKLKLAAWLDNIVPWLALGNELDPSWLSSDKNIVAAYNADPLVHDRISVRWYNEWMRIIEAIKLDSKKFKSPIFMMHGAADRATSPKAAEEMARVIHAKFQSWPGAFHELHHEPCQDQVFSAIVDWIENN